MIIKNKNYYKFFVSVLMSLQKQCKAGKEEAIASQTINLNTFINETIKYHNQDVTSLFGNRKRTSNILAYDPSKSDKVFPNSVLVGINLTKEEQKEISKCCEEYYEYEKIIEGYYLECIKEIATNLGKKNKFFLEASSIEGINNGELLANVLLRLITEQIFTTVFVIDTSLYVNFEVVPALYWKSVSFLLFFFYESTILNIIFRSMEQTSNLKGRDKQILEKLYSMKNYFYNYEKLSMLLNHVEAAKRFNFSKSAFMTTSKLLSSGKKNPKFNFLKTTHEYAMDAINIFADKIVFADESNTNVKKKWKKFLNNQILFIITYYMNFFVMLGNMDEFEFNLKNNINNIGNVIMNNPKINLREFIEIAEKYITLKLIILSIADLSNSTKKKIVKNIDKQLMQELLQRKVVIIDNQQ